MEIWRMKQQAKAYFGKEEEDDLGLGIKKIY